MNCLRCSYYTSCWVCWIGNTELCDSVHPTKITHIFDDAFSMFKLNEWLFRLKAGWTDRANKFATGFIGAISIIFNFIKYLRAIWTIPSFMPKYLNFK